MKIRLLTLIVVVMGVWCCCFGADKNRYVVGSVLEIVNSTDILVLIIKKVPAPAEVELEIICVDGLDTSNLKPGLDVKFYCTEVGTYAYTNGLGIPVRVKLYTFIGTGLKQYKKE
jgi:hypothetical protein